MSLGRVQIQTCLDSAVAAEELPETLKKPEWLLLERKRRCEEHSLEDPSSFQATKTALFHHLPKPLNRAARAREST